MLIKIHDDPPKKENTNHGIIQWFLQCHDKVVLERVLGRSVLEGTINIEDVDLSIRRFVSNPMDEIDQVSCSLAYAPRCQCDKIIFEKCRYDRIVFQSAVTTKYKTKCCYR